MRAVPRAAVHKPHPLNLADAFFSAGVLLPKGGVLNFDGTGITYNRPLSNAEIHLVRRWLAVTMPRLRVRPGHVVDYDRKHQTRHG